mgnify:CR=1 FL=1
MNKAVFLDRDGTINVDKYYLHKKEDFEFIPGVVQGLKLLSEEGYLLIIITNQSGIGRGYYTEAEFNKLNEWMLRQLEEWGVSITDVYFCPHLPDASIEKYRVVCECRKPKLGMFQKAMDDYQIDLSMSYAIGDRLRDCMICEETDCHGFLIGTTEQKDVIQRVKNHEFERLDYAESLYAAALRITSASFSKSTRTTLGSDPKDIGA